MTNHDYTTTKKYDDYEEVKMINYDYPRSGVPSSYCIIYNERPPKNRGFWNKSFKKGKKMGEICLQENHPQDVVS